MSIFLKMNPVLAAGLVVLTQSAWLHAGPCEARFSPDPAATMSSMDEWDLVINPATQQKITITNNTNTDWTFREKGVSKGYGSLGVAKAGAPNVPVDIQWLGPRTIKATGTMDFWVTSDSGYVNLGFALTDSAQKDSIVIISNLSNPGKFPAGVEYLPADKSKMSSLVHIDQMNKGIVIIGERVD